LTTAAADRVVNPLGEPAARFVERREAQPLMQRQRRFVVKFSSYDLAPAHQAQPLPALDRLDARPDAVGIDALRRLALEPEQHRAIAAMAAAGGAQRAVEIGADARRALQHALVLEALAETPRGAHRSHRVRARGADADGEEIENRDRHPVSIIRDHRPHTLPFATRPRPVALAGRRCCSPSMPPGDRQPAPQSVTHDELSHLPAGSPRRHRRVRLNPQHPPLLAAGGSRGGDCPPALPLDGAAYRQGREWIGRRCSSRAATTTRAPSGAGSHRRAVARRGDRHLAVAAPAERAAGLLSLALWCASHRAGPRPPGTMDVPVAAFATLALYAWWRAARTPARRLAAAAAARRGGAISSAPRAAGRCSPPSGWRFAAPAWRRRLGVWAVLAAGTVAMIHLAYQLAPTRCPLPGRRPQPLSRRRPTTRTSRVSSAPRASALLLVALAVKSTLPEVLAIAGGLLAAATRRGWRDDLFLWLPAVAWFAVTSAMASNQGVRYVIPALPFLFVLAGRLARRWRSYGIDDCRRRGHRSSLRSIDLPPWPASDYISYFNPPPAQVRRSAAG
jgi:hypothetical protein